MSVEEEVLGFQVSVDDVFRMQVLERKRDLGGVEFGDGVRESLQGSSFALARVAFGGRRVGAVTGHTYT